MGLVSLWTGAFIKIKTLKSLSIHAMLHICFMLQKRNKNILTRHELWQSDCSFQFKLCSLISELFLQYTFNPMTLIYQISQVFTQQVTYCDYTFLFLQLLQLRMLIKIYMQYDIVMQWKVKTIIVWLFISSLAKLTCLATSSIAFPSNLKLIMI